MVRACRGFCLPHTRVLVRSHKKKNHVWDSSVAVALTRLSRTVYVGEQYLQVYLALLEEESEFLTRSTYL